jgi:hypothetical protein
VRVDVSKLSPGVKLSVELAKRGIGVTVETDSLLDELVRAHVTLTLRSLEAAVIAFITVSAAMVVHYREAIASSWLVSNWAAHNTSDAAVIIGILTLLTGCILAYWKRNQLFVYGIGEIVFGTWSAFQTALLLWPNGETSKFVAIASALYVVSLGAGNVAGAFVKRGAN